MDIYANLNTYNFVKRIKKDFSKKQLKCLIFGNFGAYNSGDEAILKGETDLLRSEGIKDITVVSRFPNFYQQVELKPISLFQVFKIFKTIWQSDFIIVGGGGLFAKGENFITGFIFQLYMLLVFILLPKLLNKKVYVVGLGIYENTYSFSLNLALILFKFVDLLTTRDYHSYQLLAKSGVTNYIYKDLSYFLKFISKTEVSKVSPFKKTYSAKNLNVGLSLVSTHPAHEKRLIYTIKNACSPDKKTYFWLYCLDTHPGYKNDLNFAKNIIRKLQRDKYIQSINPEFIIVPNNLQADQIFSSFKLMDMFIGMRLHSLIFCYRLKIPFIGLPYDKKCTSFLESIGKTVPAEENDNLLGSSRKGVLYGY
jgi:polysaccharide pyruvyl transferase WcaK-like protein